MVNPAMPQNKPARPTITVWVDISDVILVFESSNERFIHIDPRTGKVIDKIEVKSEWPIFRGGAAFNGIMCGVDPWSPYLHYCPIIVGGVGTPRFEKILVDAHPQALAMLPDSPIVLVACDTPGRNDRTICMVDIQKGSVTRIPIPGSSNLRGIAVDPAGKFALAMHLVHKSHLPSTQIEQGWVFTNAISHISLTEPYSVTTFPLDTRTQGFANPESVAISSDGKTAYVSHGGADVVSVIDLTVMFALLHTNPKSEIQNPKSFDVTQTRRYVLARIPVGANPRGLAISPDGKTLAVANRLSDSVSLIDTAARTVTKTVSLQEPRLSEKGVDQNDAADLVRQGEILFHSGKLSFSGQFSCASCHPDGHTDGLNWDLPADGFSNFQNTKSLLGIEGTAPYGWLGKSDTLRDRFTGTLRHLFQHEPTEQEAAALEAYLSQLDYPAVGGAVPATASNKPNSPAVLRGKELFHGRAGCIECHSGKKFADRATHDIGTGDTTHRAYDTPALLRVSETAPYMHDGRAETLESIFTTHNPSRLHGNSADLSPEQLADMIAYLKSL